MAISLESLILTLEVNNAAQAKRGIDDVRNAMNQARESATALQEVVAKLDFKPLAFLSTLKQTTRLSRKAAALTGTSQPTNAANKATNLGKSANTLKATNARSANKTSGNKSLANSLKSTNWITAASSLYIAAQTAIHQIVAVVHFLVDQFQTALKHMVDYVKQVSTIKDLTGGSSKEAAQLAMMFRVSGVGESVGTRELLKMIQSSSAPEHGSTGKVSPHFHMPTSPKGAAALRELGIHPSVSLTGTQEFLKVTDSLSKMQNGVRKTQLMMDIFGARSAAAMMPMLRLTEHQRAQIALLANTFNENALGGVQAFTTSLNLLGETIEQRLIFPFVQQLLPTLTWLIDRTTDFINVLASINDYTGGILLIVGSFALLGGLIMTAVIAFGALKTAILASAAAQAVLDAFSGNWAALAAGMAVGAAVGVGVIGYNHFSNDGKKDDAIADNTKRAADALENIQGAIGGGARTRRALSDMEIEGTLTRILAGGLG